MPLNRERAKQVMERAGVDAILAASPSNVFYVSDYYSTGMQLACGTQGYVFLPLDAEPALMAPLSEADLVAESRSWIKDVHWYGCLKVNATKNPKASEITQWIIESTKAQSEQTPCDALVIAVTGRGYAKKTIAIDSSGLSPMRWETLKRNLPDAKIIDGSKLLEEIRAVKTLEEVEMIKKATEITEKSMEDALEIARPGIREIDLSQMFSYSVSEDGGRVTKDQIGFGERSAYPNPIPTTLPLAKGDLIRMSLGATWAHYNGEVTRTAAIGKASPEVEKRLKTVIDAQEAAFDTAKPGSTVGAVYAAAQKELEKGGVRECSMSLGHFIGVDCNERPWFTPGDKTVLEEGMVFTVDAPYLDLGWGGIQMEDTVLVTKKGLRFLNNTERTLYLL
ncbi:TPA: aminopeptidase P family protein [Candidatus Bathyarchaeota archaeon]|nr:aminopeptidase P family protein [Candidatus Bathyarchaeota archaeon]